MGFYLSPLVDVKELDLSTTVPAAANSIAVIVLRDTYKGPEMTQQLITSENELIDMFGKPTKKLYDHTGNTISNSACYQDMFSAIGYLKYGQKLYCTRTMSASATFAGSMLDNSGTWTGFDVEDALTLKTEVQSGDINDPDDFAEEIENSMGNDHMWVIASSRGYWGNKIRIAVIDKDTQSAMLTGGYSSYNVYNTVIGIDSRLDGDDDFLVIVQAQEQGTSTWSDEEVWNVSLDENAVDDQGATMFAETAINQGSDYIRISIADGQKNQTTVPTNWVTQSFVELSGGADAATDGADDNTIIEGYELYQNSEEIDVNIFIDGNKSETVKRQLVTICEARLDAMAIIDTKYDDNINNKGNETTDIVNWRKGLVTPSFNQNTSYAAAYGNWFNIYDKYNKEYHWVPVSGYMAGLYARTDQLTDPWFAPAGLNRTVITGVRKLAWNPTKGERDILYKNGINPIVSFAGQGKVVWGQKTMLDKESAFNRINVRRLFMTLEKSISTSAKYFLFEPNDRFTRSQIISMINPFLRDVQSRRGIYEFRVICDGTNNTAARIARDELWCDIYIKPVKAAEYIVLQFVATKQGADFSELIGEVS